MNRAILVALTILLSSSSRLSAEIVDSLQEISVWTFTQGLLTEDRISEALYLDPQYCKRASFKYPHIPFNYFEHPLFPQFPAMLNDSGAIFEGGVQISDIALGKGWPYDSEYDDDHQPPYEIPDPVFEDFVTRNTEDTIYWVPNIFDEQQTHTSIANENYLDFVLFWAYEQIDAGVNALEFDVITGGYGASEDADGVENKNEGYDDYAMGLANFATRLSVIFPRDSTPQVSWFMPSADASSQSVPAQYAFDDDSLTYWLSLPSDSHWIEIDFGRYRTVQQVYLNLHQEHPLRDFEIRYWSPSTGWSDFSPPISDSANSATVRSFLVEPVPAHKVRLTSSDSVVYLPEMKIFGQGFRQFLLQRFCVDSGWTETDPRWETEKLVDFSDPGQCPDGTMNSFNYREYLDYHGWAQNPVGGAVDTSNYLNPPNPFYIDYFPRVFFQRLYLYFIPDTATLRELEQAYSQSYSYERLFDCFWKAVTDSVRSYAEASGKEIFVTCNGSHVLPHYVDFLLKPIADDPSYPDPSPEDSLQRHLDGAQARVTYWRTLKNLALSFLGQQVPFVPFLDFGYMGMPFMHIGGLGNPADERAQYIRTYPMEMYAAGISFCFPVRASMLDAYADTLSDGTPLIEIIKIQTDFLNLHKDIYRNVVISNYEDEVTVNGVVPFNGQWERGYNYDSPVNESKVTACYTTSVDGTRSYLHIVNHNWSYESHSMMPQQNVPVRIPVVDSCLALFVISPDFADSLIPDFVYDDGAVSMTIPSLEYYVVIVMEFDVPAIFLDTWAIVDTLAVNDSSVTHLTIHNIGTENLTFSIETPDSLETITDWLTAEPDSGTIEAGDSIIVSVTMNSTGLADSVYEGALEIFSNDPDDPLVIVPVTMVVHQLPGPCEYLPADVNGSGDVNVVDITALVNWLTAAQEPACPCDCLEEPAFYACADVNGNCLVNVVDITALVLWLTEGMPVSFCADCPPSS